MKKKIFVVTEVWVKQTVVTGESEEAVLEGNEPTGDNLSLSNWHAIEVPMKGIADD